MADAGSITPTPGKETSEFSLTKLVLIVGSVVTGAGVVLEGLAQAGVGEKWIGLALVIVGSLTNLLRIAGYQSGRNQFKTAALEASAKASSEAGAKVADIEAAERVLKDLLERSK